jgi:uncharacterized protein
MLSATFSHFRGLSANTEARLWSNGVLSWSHFALGPEPVLGPKKTQSVKGQIEESEQALAEGRLSYFLERLPSGARSRVLPHCTGPVAYLDIETTGLDCDAEITTVAVYDGTVVQTYVQGRNLHELPEAIESASLLVTYNGARFDLPMLRRHFRHPFDRPHLDLMPVLRAAGFKGGLKVCERLLNVRRQVPAEMDGWEAVRLWYEFRRGHKTALDQLLAYNAQDAVSLESLLVHAYNLSMRPYPLFRPLPVPAQPRIEWPAEGE